MATVSEPLGYGDGEYYWSFGRASFKVGETTTGHQVCVLISISDPSIISVLFHCSFHHSSGGTHGVEVHMPVH